MQFDCVARIHPAGLSGVLGHKHPDSWGAVIEEVGIMLPSAMFSHSVEEQMDCEAQINATGNTRQKEVSVPERKQRQQTIY